MRNKAHRSLTKALSPKSKGKGAGLKKSANPTIDLEQYAPAYLTWIANKLSGGASNAYLRAFDVGIETWRILVLLALEDELTAQAVSKTIGMDKASVSRALKNMQAYGLVTFGLDDNAGRLRLATITEKGRALHNQILELARERERVLRATLAIGLPCGCAKCLHSE